MDSATLDSYNSLWKNTESSSTTEKLVQNTPNAQQQHSQTNIGSIPNPSEISKWDDSLKMQYIEFLDNRTW